MSRQRKKESVLTWEDPPPSQRGRYDWNRIAEELRSKPGEWAKVFDYDKTSLATAIRIDGVKALRRDKGFEVKTTNNTRADKEAGTPRMCTMFLRYNPAKDRSK